MATYNNFSDVADNAEFKDFIRDKYGITDVSQIADIEQTALLMSFKSHANDLSDADISFLEEIRKSNNKEDMEALADAELGTAKDFDQLSIDAQIYISVKNYEAKDKGVSIEQIREDLKKRDLENIKKEKENTDLHADSQEEFEDKDKLYDAFHKLATEVQNGGIGEGAGQVKPDEISDFIIQKEHYIEAHPEEKEEVNAQLGKFLNNEDQEKMFYGSELYTVDDKFRDAYKTAEKDYLDILLNRDHEDTNTGNDDNTPPPPPPSAQTKEEDTDTIAVGGMTNEGDRTKEKDPPLNVTPGGNGNGNDGNDNGGKDNGDKDNGEQEMEEVGKARIRSAYSDANEQWLDYLKLSTMKEMGVFDEEVPAIDDIEGTIDMMHKYEPKLSEAQVAELNDKVTDKILNDGALFELTPPTVLAEMYEGFKQKAVNAQDEETRNDAATKLDKVAKRIDDLTAMVATEKDLYFADVTNIADTKRGYDRMFAVRYPDLMDAATNGETDDIKTDASNKLQDMQTARGVVDSKMAAYDELWNLNSITAEKADDVDKRFEDIRKKMEGIEIDDETAKLVSNFKFLNHDAAALDAEQLAALQEQFPDRDFSKTDSYSKLAADEMQALQAGNLLPQPEPQFVDADGNQSHEWSEGAKVIPGSKLDKAITAAKQTVLLQNLGTSDEITPEFLQKEVSEQLPKTLYSLHVVDQANRGIAEKPDQFTNLSYFDDFRRNLGNIERPMAIGPTSYDAGLDNIVNQTGGYADRLVDRLKYDKDGKEVENPNLKVTTKLFEPIQSIDKRAKDRVVSDDKAQGKQHYFRNLAKTALSAFTISAAMRVVGTAAQSVTGLAWMAGGLSAAVGVATTSMQIIAWNKQRKAAGKETGFKAMCKDRRMLMTMGTTALGVAAVTCMAVPGLQGVGAVLGGASMIMGGTNSAMTAYKAARDSGDSKIKSLLKASGMLLAAGLGAWGGRAAADAGINYYNQHNPDNNIFRHKEERITDPGTPDEKRTVVDRDALEADSKRYNEQYNISDRVHHGMSHDDYIKAVEQYNSTHPDNPIINPDEMLKHAYNAQGGRVYGPGYIQEHGLDPDVVSKVGHLINTDGTINDDAVRAFQGSDLWKQSGLQNFVYRVGEDVELRPDLYPTRTPESTYSDTMMPMKDEIIPGRDPTIGQVPVDNIRPEGVAMFGVLGNIVTFGKKLKDRVGSLKDKVVGIFKPRPRPEPNPTPIPNPTPKPEPKPKPKPQPEKVDITKDMIMDEYQIIYGDNPRVKEGKVDGKNKRVEANPDENKQYKDYEKRVMEEYAADGKGKTLEEFLGERRNNYKKAVTDNLSAYLGSAEAQKAHKDVLSKDGIIPDTKKMTIEFMKNPVTHPITAVTRQNFHESKVGEPSKWTFGGFIKHAIGYLQRSSENKNLRDETKTTVVNHAILNESGKGKGR